MVLRDEIIRGSRREKHYPKSWTKRVKVKVIIEYKVILSYVPLSIHNLMKLSMTDWN